MSTPHDRTTSPDLEQLVGPIPEWRAHARAAGRAWCRSWVPYRTITVHSGLHEYARYLVTITWRWRGRIVRCRVLRAP